MPSQGSSASTLIRPRSGLKGSFIRARISPCRRSFRSWLNLGSPRPSIWAPSARGIPAARSWSRVRATRRGVPFRFGCLVATPSSCNSLRSPRRRVGQALPIASVSRVRDRSIERRWIGNLAAPTPGEALRVPVGEGQISASVMLFTGHVGPLITNWVPFRAGDAE